MEAILKDPCFRELQLAVEAASEYVPLTAMEYYIEAEESEEIANVKANNEKAKTSAFEHIKKAIHAIKIGIGNFIKKIADVFSKASMDKQTREAYEAYKAAEKENPELAKKKVSATDFKDSEKIYKQILKETEDAERKIAAGERVDASSVISRCQGYLANMTKGVATAVGAQTLLNIARSNQSAATLISVGLNADQEVMNKLEEQLGKKNAEDLNNEVAKLTNRCALYRFRLKVHHKYFGTVSESFTGAINGLKNAALGSKKEGGKEVDKLLRGNDTVARTLNARDEALSTGKKEFVKDKIKTALTNPINNAKAKHNRKAEAKREAKGDYSGADLLTYIKHNVDAVKNK